MAKRKKDTKAFLSFSSEDAPLIVDITALLSSRGKVFISHSIEPGDLWEKRIKEEVKSCSKFYVAWCCHAGSSKWVRKEVQWAKESKKAKRIIPLLLCSYPTTTLLKRHQALDLPLVAMVHACDSSRHPAVASGEGEMPDSLNAAIDYHLSVWFCDLFNDLSRELPFFREQPPEDYDWAEDVRVYLSLLDKRSDELARLLAHKERGAIGILKNEIRTRLRNLVRRKVMPEIPYDDRGSSPFDHQGVYARLHLAAIHSAVAAIESDE